MSVYLVYSFLKKMLINSCSFNIMNAVIKNKKQKVRRLLKVFRFKYKQASTKQKIFLFVSFFKKVGYFPYPFTI